MIHPMSVGLRTIRIPWGSVPCQCGPTSATVPPSLPVVRVPSVANTSVHMSMIGTT
jgi:hypothetical protein